MIHPLDELAVLSRLDSGDVSITGNGPAGVLSIGVEVKCVEDFLSSEGTGRLSGADAQIPTMLKAYDICWLLTYGSYRSGPYGRLEYERGKRWRTHSIGKRDVPFSYLEGQILTLNAAGISHKHVENEEQAAAWLAVLEKWWEKPWDAHRSFHKFNRAGDIGLVPDVSPDMLRRMRVAAALPGVGWERALAAAVSFPSVRAMINASVAEWQDVPGIGKVIAQSIVREVS